MPTSAPFPPFLLAILPYISFIDTGRPSFKKIPSWEKVSLFIWILPITSYCHNACLCCRSSQNQPQLTLQLWVVVIDNDDAGRLMDFSARWIPCNSIWYLVFVIDNDVAGRLMDYIASWIPCNSIRPLRHPSSTPGSAALQLLKAGFPKVLNSQKQQWQTYLLWFALIRRLVVMGSISLSHQVLTLGCLPTIWDLITAARTTQSSYHPSASNFIANKFPITILQAIYVKSWSA